MTKEELRQLKIVEASVRLARCGCTAEQIAKHLEPLRPKPRHQHKPRKKRN